MINEFVENKDFPDWSCHRIQNLYLNDDIDSNKMYIT